MRSLQGGRLRHRLFFLTSLIEKRSQTNSSSGRGRGTTRNGTPIHQECRPAC
ncbi:hypothetical protein [Scytonema sp. PCC 10023]|uniref:hypothetical protein n=1 Tax=Scytonema sp. PCC 10023 TaxID=1680591 RepID=UPI0039C6FD40